MVFPVKLAISKALLFEEPSTYSDMNKSVAPVVHEVFMMVKLLELTPVHELLTVISPDVALAGTVAVMDVGELTVNSDAGIPSKYTADAPVKFVPVIETTVPGGPFAGENPVIATLQSEVAFREKSSIANPSFDPAASKSFHLIQKVAPAEIDNPVIFAVTLVLFAVRLPSSNPTVGEVIGAVKSSRSISTHVPEDRPEALVLY